MAGVERFELPTVGFGDRCSTNWNYTPNFLINLNCIILITRLISYTYRVNLSCLGNKRTSEVRHYYTREMVLLKDYFLDIASLLSVSLTLNEFSSLLYCGLIAMTYLFFSSNTKKGRDSDPS